MSAEASTPKTVVPPIVDRARAVPAARQHGLGDLLRRTARRRPTHVALVAGELRWTYAELDDVVNRTANALRANGLEPGDRLAVLARNSWQYVVLTYAAAKTGIVLVPVNFMLSAGEVAFILEHAGVRGMVADADLLPVAEAAATIAGVELVLRAVATRSATEGASDGWQDVAAWSTYEDAGEPDVAIADEAPLRIMYTSGTESRPKGVVHTSRSLISQYVSCIVDGGMSADDVEVHALPLYHCAQLDCFLGPDVYLGATSIILPAPDPAALLRTIERERVTKFFAPPTVWISLLRAPEFANADLSSLRKGYYGASPMPVEILREIQERLPDVRLWNLYGQTELAPVATILPPEEQISHAGSAGRPALNVETRLVDDVGRDVAPGEIGEIVHRTPHATLGYWNDEGKTAEAFAGGWFHSGDLGVFGADGHLTVVDRKKDMIKSGGENVASREVEEAIYLHDAVAEVAVFGVPDPRWVETVMAVVVPRAGATLTEEQVIAHCRGVLAGFKTPKRVAVVEGLPKNPSGKILKRELRERFARATEEASG